MYTKHDVMKAVRRWEARGIEQKLEFLRAFLVSAVHQDTPTYEGVDEKGVPYSGPPLWEWVFHSAGYFLYHHDRQQAGNPEFLNRAIRAVREGWRRAGEHEDATRLFWEDPERQVPP